VLTIAMIRNCYTPVVSYSQMPTLAMQ